MSWDTDVHFWTFFSKVIFYNKKMIKTFWGHVLRHWASIFGHFFLDKKSSFPIVSTRSDFVLNPPPTHQHPKKPFMTIESDQRSRQLDKHSKPFLAHKYCNEMGPTDYFDRAVKLHSICKPRYRGKNKSIQRTVLRYFEFGFENCYIHFNQLNQDSQLSRVDFCYH